MNRHRTEGFTLVELLVVVAIMASLFSLVMVAGRPSTAGDVRRAAQQLASVIIAAQSRALDDAAGAGVILESDGTLAIRVSNASVLPDIIGRVSRGMPPADPAALKASIELDAASLTADATDLVHGYKVQFFAREAPGRPCRSPSAWMSFDYSAPLQATVRFRESNGQSANNTIWPAPPPPPPPPPLPPPQFEARIARYPQIAERVLDLPIGAAIDLRYSGCGDPASLWNDPSNIWGSLANKGAIAICFDSVGGLDAVMQRVLDEALTRGIQPLDPVDAVYLFVVSRAELLNPAANTLASEASVWVVIRPETGQVTLAANVPQVGVDAASVRQARQLARAGIPLSR